MTGDRRTRLRTTFDASAALYQTARPEYPDQLYTDLLAIAELPADARLLEIGCATGKATLPLARRGFTITCVELGSSLAAEARRVLSPWPRVEVVDADFEQWATDAVYDLAYAASMWGWIDPAIGWPSVASALRDDGLFATWDSRHVAHDDPELDRFWVDTQPVYERWIPHEPFEPMDPLLHHPDAIPDPVLPSEAEGLFEPVAVRRYLWDVEHDARSYTNLMRTFSNHIAIGPDRLEGLCADVADLIDTRFGGRLSKRHLTVLRVARRL